VFEEAVEAAGEVALEAAVVKVRWEDSGYSDPDRCRGTRYKELRQVS